MCRFPHVHYRQRPLASTRKQQANYFANERKEETETTEPFSQLRRITRGGEEKIHLPMGN